MRRPPSIALPLVASVILTACLASGCGSGNSKRANIGLRKEVRDLNARVARLTAENDQLKGDVRRLEQSSSGTVQALPQERLEQLWTVAGLKFGRLTKIDINADGQPLKVYLTPIDQDGQPLRAAGEITVEAFDLNAPDVRLGTWAFPLAEAKRYWMSALAINGYVLTCPWEGGPPSRDTDLLVKARFVDALTGRTVEATHRPD